MCDTDNECGCIFKLLDKVASPDAAKCKDIVLNTYCRLCKYGVGECEAMKIAAKVFKYHNPSPGPEAQDVVQCWIFEQSGRSTN